MSLGTIEASSPSISELDLTADEDQLSIEHCLALVTCSEIGNCCLPSAATT